MLTIYGVSIILCFIKILQHIMCNSFVNTFTLYLVQVCKIFPSLSPDECQKLLEACKIGMPSYVAEVAMTIPSFRNSMLYNFLEEINKSCKLLCVHKRGE